MCKAKRGGFACTDTGFKWFRGFCRKIPVVLMFGFAVSFLRTEDRTSLGVQSDDGPLFAELHYKIILR